MVRRRRSPGRSTEDPAPELGSAPPLNVALFEYNFSRNRVERLSKVEAAEDTSEEWRNH